MNISQKGRGLRVLTALGLIASVTVLPAGLATAEGVEDEVTTEVVIESTEPEAPEEEVTTTVAPEPAAEVEPVVETTPPAEEEAPVPTEVETPVPAVIEEEPVNAPEEEVTTTVAPEPAAEVEPVVDTPALAVVARNPQPAKPSICHPVNGNGQTGDGWNIISPDQASSHIDEGQYPNGVYWKHTSNDGRHDVYADADGSCPKPDTFKTYYKYVCWLVNADWPFGTTPYHTDGIFPQEYFGEVDGLSCEPPCGRWAQVDKYVIDSKADEELYHSLPPELLRGEDYSIYYTHVFVKGDECEPFDWDWQYAAPDCTALTVTYPANIPAGQANDANIRIINLGTPTWNNDITFNFHNNSGTWSGTHSFVYADNIGWPGWTYFKVVWAQVAGTNYHWEGEVICGTPPKVEIPAKLPVLDPCNPVDVADNVAWADPLPADTDHIDWSESVDGRTRTASLKGNAQWKDGTTAPKTFTLPADNRVTCEPNQLWTWHTVECGTATVFLRNRSPWIYPVTYTVDGGAEAYGPVVDNRTNGGLNGPQKDQTGSKTFTFPEDSGTHVITYVVKAGSEKNLYVGQPAGTLVSFEVETNCEPPAEWDAPTHTVVCDADDIVTVPEDTDGVDYITETEGNVTTVKAVWKHGDNRVLETWTFTDEQTTCPVQAVPADVVFTDPTCAAPQGTFTVVETEGVLYRDTATGQIVLAGDHPATGTVTIEAEAIDGYYLGKSYSWSHTFADVPSEEECNPPTTIKPEPPVTPPTTDIGTPPTTPEAPNTTVLPIPNEPPTPPASSTNPTAPPVNPGELPKTGGSSATLLKIAFVALICGVVMALVRRRREPRHAS